MFDRFTYKQKNYGLLVLFVLMIAVSYKRSFVLTIQAQNEIENQEVQKQNIIGAESDIEALRIQLFQLNKSIGKSDLPPDKVNQEILSEISLFSEQNQVDLDQIVQTHSFNTVDFTIFSNQITVRGSFNGILSLIHHMEHHFDYGRLTNVELYKERDFNSKKEILYADLLFQHYRQN